jgi:hypothetical protein
MGKPELPDSAHSACSVLNYLSALSAAATFSGSYPETGTQQSWHLEALVLRVSSLLTPIISAVSNQQSTQETLSQGPELQDMVCTVYEMSPPWGTQM